MAEDSDSATARPVLGRSSRFGLALGIALVVKLALVGVGVFTGYYTLAVVALAVVGGLLIWGTVLRRE